MLTTARAGLLVVATLFAVAYARRSEPRGRVKKLRGVRSIRFVDARLREAGLDISGREVITLWAAGALAAVGVGYSVAPAFALLAAAAAAGAVPVTLVAVRAHHDRRVRAALPALVDQIAHELRGGGTIATALVACAGTGGPMAAESAHIVAAMQLGCSLDTALAQWSHQRDNPGVGAVAGALTVAAATGGHTAAALDGLAAGLRDEAAVAAEGRALATQARLSGVVVGVAPIGYLALSAVTGGPEISFLSGTGIGRVCLATGLGLDALAIVWMRRIVGAAP